MKRRSVLPLKLPLLPGLRWTGRLTVTRFEADGSACVEFDAEEPGADPQERFVFDRAVLTPKQLEDWTGWVRSLASRDGPISRFERREGEGPVAASPRTCDPVLGFCPDAPMVEKDFNYAKHHPKDQPFWLIRSPNNDEEACFLIDPQAMKRLRDQIDAELKEWEAWEKEHG